jgi:hypothetical protein
MWEYWWVDWTFVWEVVEVCASKNAVYITFTRKLDKFHVFEYANTNHRETITNTVLDCYNVDLIALPSSGDAMDSSGYRNGELRTPFHGGKVGKLSVCDVIG